jgi:alpha-ketoglutarate-dependent taurine dioxygenase
MLHAVELPREGGATSFADLAQAQSAMPADLAARVAGRRTCFSISGATATMKQSVSDEQRQAAPDVSHPVLRRHPFLDRSILYVSPAHATGIEGMDPQEGRALLDELAAWASRSEFVYSHVWQPGDVVMWDNVQTMHRRDPFPAGEVRTMIRTGFHLPDGYGAPMAV